MVALVFNEISMDTTHNFCAQLSKGVLGGTVHEAMTDVIKLMSTLVDSSGKILVKGVMDEVKPVTAEEEALYETIDFDLDAFKKEVRPVGDKLLHDNKKALLMHRWRYPTLSLHGIEGAFHGPGAKTVMPAKVIGKFSLRLVPDQKPKQIVRVIQEHIDNEFAKVCTMRLFDKVKCYLYSTWCFHSPQLVFCSLGRPIK